MSRRIVNEKAMAVFAAFGFLASILPVLYAGLYNRACRDDLWYGAPLRQAFVSGASPGEMIGVVAESVRDRYYSWQGTYFTLALFQLQPEVFSEKAYAIVAPLAILAWIAVTAWLLHLVMVGKLGVSREGMAITTSLLLLVQMHFTAQLHSAFFWYNGIIHYLLPYLLCLLLLGLLIKYYDAKKKSTLAGIAIIACFLGGATFMFGILSLVFIGALFIICAIESLRSKTAENGRRKFAGGGCSSLSRLGA